MELHWSCIYRICRVYKELMMEVKQDTEGLWWRRNSRTISMLMILLKVQKYINSKGANKGLHQTWCYLTAAKIWEWSCNFQIRKMRLRYSEYFWSIAGFGEVGVWTKSWNNKQFQSNSSPSTVLSIVSGSCSLHSAWLLGHLAKPASPRWMHTKWNTNELGEI